jgi:cell division protein FtsB
MRVLTVALVVAIVLLQNPLWFGKGGWLKVHEINAQLAGQRSKNDELRVRNAALDAEVRDLKQGYGAIEERARSELGMIRQDELFFQVLDRAPAPQAVPAKP